MKKESKKKRQNRDPTSKSIILSKTDWKKNENQKSYSTLHFEKKKIPKNRQKNIGKIFHFWVIQGCGPSPMFLTHYICLRRTSLKVGPEVIILNLGSISEKS